MDRIEGGLNCRQSLVVELKQEMCCFAYDNNTNQYTYIMYIRLLVV